MVDNSKNQQLARGLITVVFLGLASCVCAQMPIVSDMNPSTPAANVKLPEFDVASVKQHKGDDHNMSIMNSSDGLSTTNIPLQTLIGNAYGIRQDLISGGPGWVDSTGFDVEAKVAGQDIDTLKKLNPKQRQEMLRPLLAERFHLQVHVETRTLPVYELVPTKSGSKLKLAAPEPPPDPDAKPGDPPKHGGRIWMGPGEFNGDGVPVGVLTSELSYITHRTVIDKTGLTGKYDVKLKWTPEEAAMAAGSGGSDAGTETGTTIFTAVQEQLGLRLVPAKGPVDTLVIDHVELPTEN